ncbi:MAG: hypothetical protein GXO35_01475 [Gammaproteobacteria bacterium]|nr:hypothetical protein [Gammaproteobacteria bacterium]
MCIVIIGLMVILLFYFMGSVDRLLLTETVEGLSLPVAQSWEIVVSLWPMMGFMFLAGILTVLIIMKLWVPKQLGGTDAKKTDER